MSLSGASQDVQNLIYEIRGKRVMLDFDLAKFIRKTSAPLFSASLTIVYC